MEINEMLESVEEPVEAVMTEVTKSGNNVVKNVVGGVVVYAASALAHKYVVKPIVRKIKDKVEQRKTDKLFEEADDTIYDSNVIDMAKDKE
jgi:hypothetical protein|nr:MAG TPA: hypothetical protein [Caudoviricetes sp.]